MPPLSSIEKGNDSGFFTSNMKITVYTAFALLIQTLINSNQNMFNFLRIVNSQGIYKSPYKMPDLRLRSYVQEGDIKIGALTVLSKQNSIGMCSDEVDRMAWQFIERIIWPVRQINENTKLLRNITLGFVALDFCSKTSNALAASMAFLPSVSCADVNNNTQTCFANNVASPSPTYDVIGVVMPASSRTNVPISYLYTPAKVPQMGYMSTSDELSNKGQHPYYFRVVPPDKHQVEAMLKFIADHDWSYISVIYSRGPYGEKAFDNIKERIDRYGICVATHHRLIGNVDYDAIAADLVEHSRARVVLLFIQSKVSKYVFDAVEKLNHLHHFVWLGSDSWSFNYDTNLENHKLSAIGAFSFFPYEEHVSQYYEYIGNERVSTSANPFIKTAWEQITDCSFDAGTCDVDRNIALSQKFYFTFALSLYFDAILAFAQAADDLIKDKCPDVIGEEVSNCVTGDTLTQYLMNVSFDGFTGHIEFNEENDVKGKYMIRQIVYGRKHHPYFDKLNISSGMFLTGKVVGVYDMKTESITYSKKNVISWTHLNILDRIVPLANGNVTNDGRPESVCSGPCVEREYKILKELPCCWECRRCRDNERLDVENSTCRECPPFTWPEAQTGYQTCTAISLTYQKVDDLLPVVLLATSLIAMMFTALIIVAYILYRNERVIKAASRELSFIQLSAIFIGYITVIDFQLKPSVVTCKLVYFLFCLTFALLYCPLMVKVVRIYRIFRSGSKGDRRPRFVGQRSQMIMSFILIGIQLLLCVITDVLFNPGPKRNQPVWSEELVELYCDVTVPGIVSFLAYNLVLITLCSIFAFKTRKLPDNFNESRFITMCVYTTLVIWLAFIPTYFTATHVVVRSLLLSVALLLNHTVALLFLFVPKVYAVLYVPPERITFVTTLKAKTEFSSQNPTETASSSKAHQNSSNSTTEATLLPNNQKASPRTHLTPSSAQTASIDALPNGNQSKSNQIVPTPNVTASNEITNNTNMNSSLEDNVNTTEA